MILTKKQKMGGGCYYFYGIEITDKEYKKLEKSDVYDEEYVFCLQHNYLDYENDDYRYYIAINSPYCMYKSRQEYMEKYRNSDDVTSSDMKSNERRTKKNEGILFSNLKVDKENNTVTIKKDDFEKLCNCNYGNNNHDLFEKVQRKFACACDRDRDCECGLDYDLHDENSYPKLWKINNKIQKMINFLGLTTNPKHFEHCYLD